MKPSTMRPGMLRLAFSDTDVLKACYMPFLKRKGLFVPSTQMREMGEKLFLVVQLKQQNLTVAGMASVCWITPNYCSDGRETGYGLHFDDDAGELSAAIASAVGADNVCSQRTVSYTL
ncbi:MAG: pilus assembly protein [Pseudohongiella sp.]|nr:pilus assembly protein [Pseudohongiella sp.]MDP2126318.1 pilus assembly protein [Pseudohongiella sp.]